MFHQTVNSGGLHQSSEGFPVQLEGLRLLFSTNTWLNENLLDAVSQLGVLTLHRAERIATVAASIDRAACLCQTIVVAAMLK